MLIPDFVVTPYGWIGVVWREGKVHYKGPTRRTMDIAMTDARMYCRIWGGIV